MQELFVCDSYLLTLGEAIALGLEIGAIQQVAIHTTTGNRRSEGGKGSVATTGPMLFMTGILGLTGLDYARKAWRRGSRVVESAYDGVLKLLSDMKIEWFNVINCS